MPGTPTTKYSIATLTGTDLVKNGPTAINGSLTTIDGLLAPSDQGALASRPISTVGSPGKSGRTYYATDTGQLFRDNGTGWDEIQVGSGLGVWRPIKDDAAAVALATAGSLLFVGGTLVPSGNSSATAPKLFLPNSADVAVAGRTTNLRVQVSLVANSAPTAGVTLTFGLYLVTLAGGGSSSNGNVTYTLGPAVAGSTVAITSPSAGFTYRLVSSTFAYSTLSNSALYVLGVATSGFFVGAHAAAELQMRHV